MRYAFLCLFLLAAPAYGVQVHGWLTAGLTFEIDEHRAEPGLDTLTEGVGETGSAGVVLGSKWLRCQASAVERPSDSAIGSRLTLDYCFATVGKPSVLAVRLGRVPVRFLEYAARTAPLGVFRLGKANPLGVFAFLPESMDGLTVYHAAGDSEFGLSLGRIEKESIQSSTTTDPNAPPTFNIAKSGDDTAAHVYWEGGFGNHLLNVSVLYADKMEADVGPGDPIPLSGVEHAEMNQVLSWQWNGPKTSTELTLIRRTLEHDAPFPIPIPGIRGGLDFEYVGGSLDLRRTLGEDWELGARAVYGTADIRVGPFFEEAEFFRSVGVAASYQFPLVKVRAELIKGRDITTGGASIVWRF